ncbi:DNA-binding GntR family transcriptional regulator [Pseudonocardia eucalypti]|nr:DNA-binding GntR family transcriptional regulator [Pseudonocardia eucalypti]
MTVPAARLFRGGVTDQIVADLRAQILSGELPDGERPSASWRRATG